MSVGGVHVTSIPHARRLSNSTSKREYILIKCTAAMRVLCCAHHIVQLNINTGAACG